MADADAGADAVETVSFSASEKLAVTKVLLAGSHKRSGGESLDDMHVAGLVGPRLHLRVRKTRQGG
jgi:hypothetical protein